MFRHYLFSLASAWSADCSTENELNFAYNIIIEQPGHKYSADHGSFVEKVFNSEIKKLPDLMSNAGVVSTEELVCVLTHCQWKIMKLMLDWHKETGGGHTIDIPDELAVIDFEALQQLLASGDIRRGDI